MKHLYEKAIACLLLIGGLESCEQNPIIMPPVVYDENCLGFKEIGVCSFFNGNYGTDFQSALDSIIRYESKWVDSLITDLEVECSDCGYNRNETRLEFDTVHVATDDIALDRTRTYIYVWLTISRKPFDAAFSSEPVYVQFHNYGIIDSRGDRYLCNEKYL